MSKDKPKSSTTKPVSMIREVTLGRTTPKPSASLKPKTGNKK